VPEAAEPAAAAPAKRRAPAKAARAADEAPAAKKPVRHRKADA
jgi:hypothetical protein